MPVISAPPVQVWILEPESEFRTLLVELSILHGHSTASAQTLSQAWQLLSDAPLPQLVVTPWELHGETVETWIREILRRAPQSQVICFATQTLPEQALPRVRFLVRPEQLSELIHILNLTRSRS